MTPCQGDGLCGGRRWGGGGGAHSGLSGQKRQRGRGKARASARPNREAPGVRSGGDRTQAARTPCRPRAPAPAAPARTWGAGPSHWLCVLGNATKAMSRKRTSAGTVAMQDAGRTEQEASTPETPSAEVPEKLSPRHLLSGRQGRGRGEPSRAASRFLAGNLGNTVSAPRCECGEKRGFGTRGTSLLWGRCGL